MKNLKWCYVFGLLIVSLAVAGFGTPHAEAAVKITIKNNRSHNLALAFGWSNMDTYQAKGWYTVKAGETRTITLKDVISSFTMDGFSYYAKGGGSTWAGKTGDDLQFWIHPTQAFDLVQSPSSSDDFFNLKLDEPVEGTKKVYFRRIALKKTGDRNTDARATLTFSP